MWMNPVAIFYHKIRTVLITAYFRLYYWMIKGGINFDKTKETNLSLEHDVKA
jgi:hypothetical protein